MLLREEKKTTDASNFENERKKERKKESDSHIRIEILFILTRSNVAMKLMLFL
jgi:hypothetical protein